jgi:superfamily II helicase
MSLLINRVLEQVKADLSIGDLTALDELLTFVPRENLIAYLPEEEWNKYENEYCCDNCGGGFIREEMDFDVNDQDLCKNCNHISFNDAPYGKE